MSVLRLIEEKMANEEKLIHAEAEAIVLRYHQKRYDARLYDTLKSLDGKVLIHANRDSTTAYWIDKDSGLVECAPCVYSTQVNEPKDGGPSCQ